ncbi:hypothetical protein HMPREF0294_2307 [Corynebacterium glucuronolyticum ATCC 51867]|nr:hypothetical protein HMPREF0294_2307 [Corynebacterium glucuronolyticum ATCC 51867]
MTTLLEIQPPQQGVPFARLRAGGNTAGVALGRRKAKKRTPRGALDWGSA